MPAESDSSAPHEFRPGEHLLGKYRLLEPLATGGMGRVWTARNLATGADVAVKVLLPALVTSPEGLARFRREARITAALSHRAIVRVFDLIELDGDRGSLVIVMELLRGHTLAHHLEHLGRLSVQQTLQIVFPLLSALSHAHALGVVHRDLKPENVFIALEPDGQRMPKIVDFGISKLLREHPITLSGQVIGTLNHMSPEQTRGQDVDQRTDIFSMGVLLYECLAGRNPFVSPRNDESTLRRMASVFDVEPEPLRNIPPTLWEVVGRALAKDARERHATVAELAEALHHAVPWYSEAVPPPPSARPATSATLLSGGEPPKRVAKSRRAPTRIATGALLASLLSIAVTAPGESRPSRAPRATRRSETAVVHQKHVTSDEDLLRVVTLPPIKANADSGGISAEVREDHSARWTIGHGSLHAAPAPSRSVLAQAQVAGLARDPGF